MATTIVQKVTFKNTTPKALYDLYMDAKKHSVITDSPVKISDKEGGELYAFDGYITGKNLHLIKDRLIVQSLRGSDWSKDDIDSTFIINFEPKGKDVILHAVHANVPDKHAADLDKGWHDHYWNPMKQYVAGKPLKHPEMHSNA